MSKETYYFSHDGNARNDENILMLRAEHGWEGYGIYWALLEMMFESAETELFHKKIKGLSVSYNIDITLLKNVINTCIEEGLFVSDGETFYSESLRRRKGKFQEIKRQKSEAGKKGMEKRWANKGKDNTVITDDNTVITKDNKGKESKGKERKVKESKLDSRANEDDQQPLNIVQLLIENNIISAMGITKTLNDDLNDIHDNFNFIEPDQVISEAIKYAVRGNGKTWRFIYNRLEYWRKTGIKTAQDAIDLENSSRTTVKGVAANAGNEKARAEFSSDWQDTLKRRKDTAPKF